MPVSSIILALPLAAAAPAAAILPFQPPVEASQCPKARPRLAQDAQRPQPRRLDQLPPGRLELAVHREVAGCAIPAVLREGLGGPPRP